MKLAIDLRAEKIVSHSTVLRAIGSIGADLMKEQDWEERLQALQSIDCRRRTKEWENVCIVANSVVSNRQARAATRAYIKSKLGMPLTEAEARSIPQSATAVAA